jgi:hypothetical protein
MRARISLLTGLWLLGMAPLAAQPAVEAPPPPAVRRWVDVQNLHLMTRYRWVKSNDGRITSSTHQWQPQIRGRFLIDRQARYSINVNAHSGAQFVSSWNNTGGGLGRFAGDFNVKQLFLAAEPVRGLQLETGGLHVVRGENTEVVSYDNDAYLVGHRAIVRPRHPVVSQVAVTAAHLGDYRTPNVFRRLDSLADLNYAHLLVGLRLHDRVSASADYTYEDGRDILRQAVSIRMPDASAPLTALKVEAYQRVSDIRGEGFNVSGDLRLTRAFTVTAGVTHVDRFYLIPGYMSPNADRYERGSRFYSQGTYALSREVSIGWFHTEAFGVDYVIPNEHRWEILLTFNPTATLKAKRIF